MPVRPQSESSQKAAVSVSEAAALCGLSRTHFHALIKDAVFPPPLYTLMTRKPFYSREILEECLRIRRTNVTAEGRVVLFYERRQQPTRTPTRRTPSSTAAVSTPVAPARHGPLVDGLRSLGLASTTDAQVDNAMGVCFPNGVGSASDGEVLRTLWQQLRRSQAV